MRLDRRAGWGFAWLVLVLAGALAIVRFDIAQRREAFAADARVVHRLLSQRAAQNDAILGTLVLLNPAPDRLEATARVLPALYPQVRLVRHRAAGEGWPDGSLDGAERRSRLSRHAETALVDGVGIDYLLVSATPPTGLALGIDLQHSVTWAEWPIEQGGPVRVSLSFQDRTWLLQPGQAADAEPVGLTEGFIFDQALASESQPFALHLRQATGAAQWPWPWLGAWALLCTVALTAIAGVVSARRGRRRAEQLLRVGQVGRLNAMGELAAGMAHELNQPLTAIVAGAQAARRLLDDGDEAQLDAARHAMTQVAAQGRRAADVVGRLRRRIEGTDIAATCVSTDLRAQARKAIDLFGAEIDRLAVQVTLRGASAPVLADPVALEQIVHNLIANALQALDGAKPADRRLDLDLSSEGGMGVLRVRDHGPGMSPEVLGRVFEPFFTMRESGLGLGLSLCESLAQAMHGTLDAHHASPHGAVFCLKLPLAPTPAA